MFVKKRRFSEGDACYRIYLTYLCSVLNLPSTYSPACPNATMSLAFTHGWVTRGTHTPELSFLYGNLATLTGDASKLPMGSDAFLPSHERAV